MLQTSILTILGDDRKLSKFIVKNFKNAKISVSNSNETLIKMTNIKKINPVIYKVKTSKSSITILYFKSNSKYNLLKQKYYSNKYINNELLYNALEHIKYENERIEKEIVYTMSKGI